MVGIMLIEISQTEKANTVWCHLYVESKKQQTSGYNKKETDSMDIENKWVIDCWGKRSNIVVRQWEVQTTGCKIVHKVVLYNTGDIVNYL